MGLADLPREDESWPGQFIPLHYHYNMLLDSARIGAFREAIDRVVRPGMKVLELGGGTGILSWLAARRGALVCCVERNPQLAAAARKFLKLNAGGERVQVVQADALDYLPPEPVDVVICEMLHVALVREKQVPVLESFGRRYARRFGARRPVYLPEASILAVQPVEQSFDFGGYLAPIPIFQSPTVDHPQTRALGEPIAYAVMEYSGPLTERIAWQGVTPINQPGRLNAVRLITKNVLAVLVDDNRDVPWWNQYLVLPLPQAVDVQPGDSMHVSLAYPLGGSLEDLSQGLECGAKPPRDTIAALRKRPHSLVPSR